MTAEDRDKALARLDECINVKDTQIDNLAHAALPDLVSRLHAERRLFALLRAQVEQEDRAGFLGAAALAAAILPKKEASAA